MTPELQKYYEALFEMFATDGWRYLMEDFQTLKNTVGDISLTSDSNDLWFRKGQLDILNLFLSRQAMSRRTWDDLQAAEEADSV